MSALTSSPHIAPPIERRRDAFAFLWPLSLTYVLMAATTPIVNAGLSAAADGPTDIAAFSLAVGVVSLLNSTVFGLEATAAHLIADAVSLRRFFAVSVSLGAVVGALELALGTTGLGRMVYGDVYGVDAAVQARAVTATAWLSPLPVLIAVRVNLRGVLIRTGDTLLVGISTIGRFAAMFAVMLVGVRWFPSYGMAWGAVCVCAGVAVECALLVPAARAFARARPGGGDAPAVRDVVRFLSRVTSAELIEASLTPATQFVLARAADPRAALAAYSVSHAVVWLVFAPMTAIINGIVARSRTPREARVMARAATLIAAGTSVGAAMLAVPAIGRAVLGRWMGVHADVVADAAACFAPYPLIALVFAVRHAARAEAVRAGRPGALLGAGALGVAGAYLAGRAILPLVTPQALTGALMFGTTALIQALWLRATRPDRGRPATDTDAVEKAAGP